MVRRAVSEQVKKIKVCRKLNSIHQEAVDEYHWGQLKSEKKHCGLQPSSAKHGINFKTLSNLVKGKQSMSTFNTLKKKLSDEEEHVLVDPLLESADWGLPFTQSVLHETANSIIKGHDGESYTPVSEGWVSWFLDWHHDEIQEHWSQPLDTQRDWALNPEVIQKWFELVKESCACRNQTGGNLWDGWKWLSPFWPRNTACTQEKRNKDSAQTRISKLRGCDSPCNCVCIWDNSQSLCHLQGKNFQKTWCHANVSNAALVAIVFSCLKQTHSYPEYFVL